MRVQNAQDNSDREKGRPGQGLSGKFGPRHDQDPRWDEYRKQLFSLWRKNRKSLAHLPALWDKDAALIEQSLDLQISSQLWIMWCLPAPLRLKRTGFAFLQTSDRTCSFTRITYKMRILSNLPNSFEIALTFQLQDAVSFITCILNRTNSSYHVFYDYDHQATVFFNGAKDSWGFCFRAAVVLWFACASSKLHECFQRKTWQVDIYGFGQLALARCYRIGWVYAFMDSTVASYSVHECSNQQWVNGNGPDRFSIPVPN